MKDHIIETDVWLPYPREIVFEFFKAAENLQIITPPWLDFQIITPLQVEMREGAIIDYKLRLYGIPMKWQTQIAVWEPPYNFVDMQLTGPYSKWVHTHDFTEKDGGTQMHDRVEYRVPGGPLSGIIHRLLVRKNVEAIFAYRQSKILKISPETDPVIAG